MNHTLLSRPASVLALALAAGALHGQAVRDVNDDSFVGGQTYTLDADTTYIFDGQVFVEEGATLNIPAGTVLQFTSGAADQASALIIARGAQIFARGTAEAPVILTYDGDDVTDPNDIPEVVTRGLWGGLIILGSGTVALDEAGIGQIEGIDPNEPRAQYGGGANPDDDESSGVLTYVSIRHAGAALAPGDEINGLTLGGVGRGTEIDYVEVYANLDDGIEWFGGAVDVKHAVVSFCGDDSYDYDQGWRGRGQYWFSYSGTDVVGRAGEWDGAIPDANDPFATVTLANATFIGAGTDADFDEETGGDGNDYAIVIRDGAGARVYNSIITDFPERAVNLEDLSADRGVDSYQRLLDGDVDFEGVVFGDFGRDDADVDSLINYYSEGDDPTGASTAAELTDGNQFVGDAGLLRQIDRASAIDPRPLTTGAGATATATLPDDDFFDDVDYAGAFDPTEAIWAGAWTAMQHYSILGGLIVDVEEPTALAANSLALVPNPANRTATLNFDLTESAEVVIDVLDVSGRRVARSASLRGAGAQRAQLNVAGLADGAYVVRVVSGGGVLAQQLVVRH